MTQRPECNANGADCTSVVQQLWEYLDGELTPERTEQVRRHLELCGRCYPHYDFERMFLEALAACRRSEARCPDVLRRRIAESLREAGFSRPVDVS